MLELDVHRTLDGVLVVHHDATVDRCTDGTGRIAELHLSELKRLDAGFRFSPDGRTFPRRGQGVVIPTLREVLEGFPNTLVNLEVKAAQVGIEREVAAELRALGAIERVCLGSELDEVAERLHHALPEACHFFPRNALTSFVVGALSGNEEAPDVRFHVADMPFDYEGVRVVTPEVVRAARGYGLGLFVWTIDDALLMRTLLELGVDGIMTDRPDVLRQVLDAFSDSRREASDLT
jgi:glycerophosphoryl diester phosphodiesterase